MLHARSLEGLVDRGGPHDLELADRRRGALLGEHRLGRRARTFEHLVEVVVAKEDEQVPLLQHVHRHEVLAVRRATGRAHPGREPEGPGAPSEEIEPDDPLHALPPAGTPAVIV
jgi:hypothetical protein